MVIKSNEILNHCLTAEVVAVKIFSSNMKGIKKESRLLGNIKVVNTIDDARPSDFLKMAANAHLSQSKKNIILKISFSF
jgi:hypothetical protein